MDGSPALLLLLALGLCCPGIHGQRYKMKVSFRDSSTQLQLGQRLELKCQTDRDHGVFWVRQDKTGTLHFIVFISSVSRVTFSRNKGTPTRFEVNRDNMFYWLVVKTFTEEDEGNYFCLKNINQMLYFSHGLPVFLPVITTPGPTTQRGITGSDSYVKTPDPESITKKELSFFCDGVIWVPSAGACLLLLIALAITILQCGKTRRRRGKCKRPAQGKPHTKPRTTN